MVFYVLCYSLAKELKKVYKIKTLSLQFEKVNKQSLI